MINKKKTTRSSITFWDLNKNRPQNDIWSQLYEGMWKKLLLDEYLTNELLPAKDFAMQRAVFSGFQQIVPGTKWNELERHLELDLYRPKRRDCTFAQFVNMAGEFFESLNAHCIGVHLSGGLDSSIIIGLLKELKMPFVAIGFKSDTFEFRTERRIQELILEDHQVGELIDIENYPLYSDLMKIPRHQLPMSDIRTYAMSEALATSFAKYGCDVVLTGQGGDTVFVDAITDLDSVAYNIGCEFENHVEQKMHYAPNGIQLLSFYAQPAVLDALSTVAIGRKVDCMKKWARQWFATILPRELVDYTYCADFLGLSLGSLERAKPTIKLLFEEAYDLSKKKEFSPVNTRDFLKQDVFSFEYYDFIKFCSLLSVSVWYHSLMNN